MRRGEIYDARLSPTEGYEQAGTRPVLIVSRDVINQNSPVIIVVPFTNARNVKRTYPNNVLVPEGEGGLTVDSVLLGGQVRAIARSRLLRLRGSLSTRLMEDVDQALRITLAL
jgi:mRNA interferase MazF